MAAGAGEGAPGGAGAEEALARALRGRERELADLAAELARARAAAGGGAGAGGAGGGTQVAALALDPGVHREFCQMKDEIVQARTRIKVGPPVRPPSPLSSPPTLRPPPPCPPPPMPLVGSRRWACCPGLQGPQAPSRRAGGRILDSLGADRLAGAAGGGGHIKVQPGDGPGKGPDVADAKTPGGEQVPAGRHHGGPAGAGAGAAVPEAARPGVERPPCASGPRAAPQPPARARPGLPGAAVGPLGPLVQV